MWFANHHLFHQRCFFISGATVVGKRRSLKKGNACPLQHWKDTRRKCPAAAQRQERELVSATARRTCPAGPSAAAQSQLEEHRDAASATARRTCPAGPSAATQSQKCQLASATGRVNLKSVRQLARRRAAGARQARRQPRGLLPGGERLGDDLQRRDVGHRDEVDAVAHAEPSARRRDAVDVEQLERAAVRGVVLPGEYGGALRVEVAAQRGGGEAAAPRLVLHVDAPDVDRGQRHPEEERPRTDGLHSTVDRGGGSAAATVPPCQC